jgi:hypothetical protein
MAFQVPAAKKSIGQNWFEFQMPGDDTVYRIPAVKTLKLDRVADIERSLASVRDLFEEHAPGVFARFDDAEQFNELVKAWQSDSGVTLGESEASASS